MTTDNKPRIQRRSVLMATAGLALTLVLSFWLGLAAPVEHRVLNWLQDRQAKAQDSFGLAAVSTLDSLTEPQALLVSWLSRKYRVAPEPLSALVLEAFELGDEKGLDPALILSVAANESRFNPMAQSPVGAQGLMQVLTRVHTDKFEAHGGTGAAFDPLTNMRVGSQILRDSIRRAGSVQGGLRQYVGAVKTDGRGYIHKVLAEQLRLHSVMAGKSTSFSAIPAGMPEIYLPEPELVANLDEGDI